MRNNEVQELHASQIIFDDKRTLQEVIASINAKIDAISATQTEATTLTEEGESNE